MKKRIIAISLMIIVLLVIVWELAPIPNYSLKYSIENGFVNYKAEIEINKNGTLTYSLLSYMDEKPYSKSAKLSSKDKTSLGRLMMRNRFFFMLPNNLSRHFRTDQDGEEIELFWKEKKYTSGGYDVGNVFFRSIVSRLESYVEEYKLQD